MPLEREVRQRSEWVRAWWTNNKWLGERGYVPEVRNLCDDVDGLLAALAVAREREQRAAKALPFVDDALEALRDGAGKAVRPDTARTLLAKARAALVDEPAAAIGRQAVDDYRQDLAKLGDVQTVASVGQPPAAATLAEPEQGTASEEGVLIGGNSPVSPGSASAAADEPGETPPLTPRSDFGI